MPSALVAGATGFIGTNLVQTLLAAGVTTYGLVRSTSTNRLRVEALDGFRPVPIDSYDTADLASALAAVEVDVVYSVLKCLVFITLITFIHCYYGFTVRGGPEDVGRAVGRSVRLSVTLIFIVNFFMSLVFFGATSSIRFSG